MKEQMNFKITLKANGVEYTTEATGIESHGPIAVQQLISHMNAEALKAYDKLKHEIAAANDNKV